MGQLGEWLSTSSFSYSSEREGGVIVPVRRGRWSRAQHTDTSLQTSYPLLILQMAAWGAVAGTAARRSLHGPAQALKHLALGHERLASINLFYVFRAL